MPILVREASLPADREWLLATLLCNRPNGDHSEGRARFEWSYSSNPYGNPRAWLVVDQASGAVVGATAAFPRRFLVDGRPVVGWNGGDTDLPPVVVPSLMRELGS